MTAELANGSNGSSEWQYQSSVPADAEIRGFIANTRSMLKPGGPEVVYEPLYAYIAEGLDDDARTRVERLICTYRSWYEAYWALLAEVEGAQAHPDGR